MRVEHERASRGPKSWLMGAVMGLTLVGGALLSLGAPTEPDTNLVEITRPEPAGLVATTPDGISPSEVIAERSTLDLQLD